MMTDWTVMLKRGGEGVDFRVIKADSVAWSENREALEFTDIQAGLDALLILNSMIEKSKDDKLSKEEAEAMVRKLIRTYGQITVASFEREAVLGYFKGKKARLDFNIEPRE